MTLDIWDGILIVLLAVIEVAIVEGLIRMGLVGVAWATGALFILILLNGASVVRLRRLWRR
jgi:hypothetical protein